LQIDIFKISPFIIDKPIPVAVLKRLLSLLILSSLLLLSLGASSQCVSPIGSDSSLCSPASVDLTVTGNTGFYNWYNSPFGPSFLNTGSTFTTPVVNLRDTFYVSEYDTGATTNALLFDGTNDRAAIQNFNYNSTGLTEATVEVWIKTTNSDPQIIASYDRTEYWRLEISGSGAGPGQIGFDVSTDAGVLDFGGTTRIDDGLWHHVAGVIDNGTISIYIDGVLDTSTVSGTTFGTGISRYGFLGVGSEADVFDGTTGPNNYFDGEMGNFRLWSVARTQTEIQQSISRCLNGPQSGLDVVYTMNGSGTEDEIIDYSGNQFNAEFRNFPVSGAWVSSGPALNTCFQCESARDTVIVDIIPTPTDFLGGNACVAGDSVVLDPGINFQNFLWQDNSTQQTFTARSSGVYSVTVDDLNGCPGGDTVRVFINPEPTGIDTSFCGQDDYQLRATGSNGLYKWYDDLSSTLPIDTGRLDFTLNQTDTFYVAGYDTSNKSDALEFDDLASNYASILNYSLSGTTYTELTVQCWIKTTNGNDQIIASFDRSEYWRLEINGDGGSFGTIGFDIATSTGINDFGGNIRVDDGNWHHIAAVFDNGTRSIYVDGVLDNTTSRPLPFFGIGTTRFGFIGTGSESSTEDGTTGPDQFFDGSIADFSIYERALTLSEIQASRFNCKVGGEAGLEVYYPFTEGAGTLLKDRSGNGRNAILKNTFPVNAWSKNEVKLSGCPSDCESERDTVIALLNITPRPNLGPDVCASTPTIIDAGSNYSSYLWNTAETTQTISVDENNEGQFFVTVDSAGTPCSGSDTIFSNIILLPDGRDSSRCGPGEVELQAQGGTNFRWYDKQGIPLTTGQTYTPTVNATDTFLVSAVECNDTLDVGLTFDGNNDYIALDMFYNVAGQLPVLTVEAWVKTTVSSGGQTDNWAIVDFDRSEYYDLYVHGDGRVGFSTEPTSGSTDDFYSDPAVRVNDGTWHHIAGVYDGVNKYIYIDGDLISTRLNPHGGAAIGSGSTRYGIIGDGSEASTFNGNRNNIHYDGEIAEVRIWHAVRTADQIKENMDFCVDASEAGLAAYYKTNDGRGSDILTDYSGNNRHGTLFNMNSNNDWINTNNPIFCECCISDGDTAIATVYDVIDSNRFVVSCPSVDSSKVLVDAFGGSGAFDLRELSGEFAYSSNYVSGQSRRSLENGGSYQIEIQDQNGCLDTTSTINVSPSPTSIASSTSSGSCRIVDQNDFAFIVNGSNEVIVGIRSPSSDLGEMSATAFLQANAMIFNEDAYLGRNFLINSDSTVSSFAEIRFPLLGSELTDLIDSANSTLFSDDNLSSVADLGVTRYNGPTEDGIYNPTDATNLVFLDQIGSGSQFGGDYFDVSTTGFSEFWPHPSATSTPLPIELKDFSVSLNSTNAVLIAWSTYSEINNDYFTIEKTADGKHWVEVAQVDGSGNSTTTKNYSTVDLEPYSGKSYYRLKQTDFDGRYENFKAESIKIAETQTEADFMLYPNPSNGRITLELPASETNSEYKIGIYSYNGTLIYEFTDYIETGSDSIGKVHLDATNLLDNGIYIVSFRTASGIISKKLVIKK